MLSTAQGTPAEAKIARIQARLSAGAQIEISVRHVEDLGWRVFWGVAHDQFAFTAEGARSLADSHDQPGVADGGLVRAAGMLRLAAGIVDAREAQRP